MITESDPGFYSPVRRERRRKLLKLAKESFPNGIPSPYAMVSSRSTVDLPFICATIKIISNHDDSKIQLFQDVWCLWNLEASISYILTSRLKEEIRGSSHEGFVMGEITYAFRGILLSRCAQCRFTVLATFPRLLKHPSVTSKSCRMALTLLFSGRWCVQPPETFGATIAYGTCSASYQVRINVLPTSEQDWLCFFLVNLTLV